MKDVAQYIYGRNAVVQAIEGHRVRKVFLALGFSSREIIDLLNREQLPIEYKENDWLKQQVGPHHQGIIALTKPYDFVTLDEVVTHAEQARFPLIVMLDSIQDPHNFGAIIRNAEAFGAGGIIIRKDRQVGLTAVVAKVSSGAIEHMPITQVANLSQTLKQLQQSGYWVIASALENAIDYREFDYNRKIVIIIGSEGSGVAPLVLKNSDAIVKIPMMGTINSLNASAASAVLLAHIQASRFPL